MMPPPPVIDGGKKVSLQLALKSFNSIILHLKFTFTFAFKID